MMDKYYHQAGLRIHYLDWGGGKEAVLFLHGTTGNAHHWDFCARRLQGGFRVLSLDFRGHGDSSKPLSGYRKEDYLADVTALIEALDLKQVSLVGYSLGALVSIAYAAKHPDQIRCAVLVDPSIGTPRELSPIIKGWQQRPRLPFPTEKISTPTFTRNTAATSISPCWKNTSSGVSARHPHARAVVLETQPTGGGGNLCHQG